MALYSEFPMIFQWKKTPELEQVSNGNIWRKCNLRELVISRCSRCAEWRDY